MRRLVLSMVVAVAFSGAGSALLASTAAAGGVDGNTGVLTAAVYNVTPYTWTLVAVAGRSPRPTLTPVPFRRLLRPPSRPARAASSG